MTLGPCYSLNQKCINAYIKFHLHIDRRFFLFYSFKKDQPGERPQAGIEFLLHLSEQFLGDPVGHGPAVEEGDEDVRESSLNVPQQGLCVGGVDKACQDVSLESLLPESSLGVCSKGRFHLILLSNLMDKFI